jgi:regulator of protease activity HflC (stomatin/prohibitin superfamily)
VENNVPKNGVVNLVAALLVFIATFAVTSFVKSLAGEGATVFMGITVLIAFASWFQMRLEENERLEKLEVDELSRSRGESSLFEAKDSEVFAARRSREQFEKFFVPGLAILLFILEAGAAWILWRWMGRPTAAFNDAGAMASLSLYAIFALLLFLLGRFSVTMARLEDHRLSRPGASFILAGAYVCFFTALAIAVVKTQYFPRADFWLGRAFCILLGLMAVEILLTLLLEIYRPRVRGKISRPLYDSRLIGILAQPESLFTTAAQTLDYQFGFKVSETWFFQMLKENLPALILAQLAILLLSSCVVFVDAGEQAILEHFGKPVAALTAGGHFKWPWPVDKVYRYRTDQIQSIYVGYQPGTNDEQTILWTVPHNNEQNFIVATHLAATIDNETPDALDSDQSLKAPPVSLVSVSIPVQFQITNVMQWAYINTDASNLLEDLAARQVAHYLVGQDIDNVLSEGRLEAADDLQNRIQNDADEHQLGVKILFVGLQDVHPPTTVAGDYEKVVGAEQIRLATNLLAQAYAIQANALSQSLAYTTTNVAEAKRLQVEMTAYARAALFTNQIPAYEAAPSVYKQRLYYSMFADATKNSRKYILLVTNTQNILIFDLEDKIRSDLLNVNPE